MNAQSRIAKTPLYFFNGVGGATDTQVITAIRREQRLHDIKMVVLDYLQKVKPSQKAEKKTYEIGAISSSLKGAADKTGVCLVALAQLSREPDKDKGRVPRVSDLADSAQIERDADSIALLHRLRTENDPEGRCARLFIGKQWDGAIGDIDLIFDGQYCRFHSATRAEGF